MTRKPAPRRHAIASAAAAALVLASAGAQAATFSWTAGTFTAGVTAPSPLPLADVLNINAGSTKFFDGNVSNFSNAGTVNWNADPLYFQGGAAVANSGVWNATSDQQMIYNGGAGPSFTNTGTFRKSGGAGITLINDGVGFVNSGTLDAQTGTIAFTGGSTFNAGTVFTGAGTVAMVSGTNHFNGAFTSSNLVLAGGTFQGNSAVLGGTVRFTGSVLAGTWAIDAGQTLRGEAGGNKFIAGDSTVVTNSGTFEWNTGNPLYLQSGATLRNQALFVANTNTSVVYNGGAGPAFTNSSTGTVRAASGATLTIGSGTGFVNNGGTLDAGSGAAIVYASGSTFNNGTQFTGAGSHVAAGNNTFNNAFTSANLVLQSGIHTGGGAVLNGAVSFTGGALAGGWTVAAGQTLNGNTGSNKFINGDSTIVTNDGTFAWNTGDALYLQGGATLRNQALFVANASTMVVFNGGAAPAFTNSSAGTVRAASGVTLNIGSGTGFVNNGGTLDARSGAAIVYASGATFNNGTQFTGAGSNVAAGNNSFNGSFTSTNLVLQSGIHTGSGAVINGNASYTGGTLSGTWTVGSGQTLTAADGGNKLLGDASSLLTNQGTVNWNTGNPLYLQGGGKVSNAGLFLASQNTQVLYNGGAAPQFDNTATGTVRAAAGVALTFGASTGLVNNGGVLDALAGGSISYTGGSTFNAGTQFTGAGSNVVTGNNGFNGSFTSTNLVLASGTHSGGAAVVNGTAAFSGGALAGTWTVGNGQTLAGQNGATKNISGGGTVVTNLGTIAWNTGDVLYLQSGATLLNQGLMNFNANASVIYNGGTGPSFVNAGLITKTGLAGTTGIGDNLGFNNLGTIDVQVGTFALPTNFTNNGTLMGLGTFGVGGTLTNAGTVAPGASPGTLNLAGNFAQAAGGRLAVELQSGSVADLFKVSGTAALGGQLAISCWAACSLGVGEVVTILDSNGALSGTFASVALSGFATGAFDVIYDTANTRVQLVVTQAVTAVPEPGTWALWLAGAAMLGGMAGRRAAAS